MNTFQRAALVAAALAMAGPAVAERAMAAPVGETPQQLAVRLHASDVLRLYAKVDKESINEEARTVEIAWASEAPVPRWFGFEVLDCTTDSIRLARLMDGAPLLFNHDRDGLIGVVESVSIGSDRVCRAVVRFDTSEEAEKRWRQVLNGVLRHVSVGYAVSAMVLESDEDGIRTYRITDWEPYELSMVTIPADHSVGVGRSADLFSVSAAASVAADPATVPTTDPTTIPATPKENRSMPQTIETPTQPPENADVVRRDALLGLGQRYADYISIADVQTACRDGHTPEQLQELVIQRMTSKHSDTRNAHIGMSDKDVGRYSVARAVAAMVTGDWKAAGLEREASEAAAKMFGGTSRGLLLPMDVMSRSFNVGTAAEAGNLVPTTLRDDMFADVLRSRLAMGRLGATMLFGLTGNVDLPRKTSGSALSWLTEVAGAATTQVNTGKVSLTPKRIGGVIEFSKQAVIQSAMAVEPLLRQDVMSEYQVQFETAAINGSGAAGQPRGLRNTSGVGSVVGGANGASPTWAHAVALESACANVNAEPDARSGYLINTRLRGTFKTTQKAANLPFIWENGATPLNGYRAEVTNIVPNSLSKGTSAGVCSSLIFGSNWEMFVMAQFGAIELLLDEVSLAANGLNRLLLNAFVDTGARRAADFSVMDDALAG